MKNLLRFMGMFAAVLALMYQVMRFAFDFLTRREGDTRDYTWPMALSIALMVVTLLFGLYCLYGLIRSKK